MEEIITDAHVPAEMASRAESSAIRKANRDVVTAFFLAVQAGSFVALGGAFFTAIITDSSLGLGLTKTLGGMAFSLGMVLVIIAGADLFTGDTLVIMGCLSKKVKIRKMLKGWLFVFFGNLAGSLAILALVHFSNHWTHHDGMIGLQALQVANAKVSQTFLGAFCSGMLCNILVCLAIWLCYGARSVTDKILAIMFPITAFVALGLDNCVANMYLVPAGLLIKNHPEIVAQMNGADLSNLTIHGFLFKNMLPVTLGNMIGGAIFVGAIYWILYLRKLD
ncbi:MAG: formate/nitrite transporter family protein [Pontiella sp.]